LQPQILIPDNQPTWDALLSVESVKIGQLVFAEFGMRVRASNFSKKHNWNPEARN
jgi:hypothetical protein